MHIETIDTSASLPVALNEPAQPVAVPPEVKTQAKQGKLWHLLAWKDAETKSCGFYRKNVAVVLPLDRLHSAIINVMRPAKGRGSVSLDVWLEEGRRCVPVFEAAFYNPDAVVWFLKHKNTFEGLLGRSIEVRDLGSDY